MEITKGKPNLRNFGEATGMKVPKSQPSDPKPSDLILGKVKSPIRGMEACN